MRRWATVLVLLVAASAPAESVPETKLDRVEMVADLGQLVAAAKKSWAYLEHRRSTGIVLDTLLADAVAGLPDHTDPATFAVVVRRLVAAMQDGHAWVATGIPDRRDHVWPFTVVDAHEGLIVDRVDAGLRVPRRGDRLVAVDSVNVADIINTGAGEQPASTSGMRRARALLILRLTEAARNRFTFSRASGPLDVELANESLIAMAPPVHVSKAWISAKKLSKRIGYLRIVALSARDQKQWLDALPTERDALLAGQYEEIDKAFDSLAKADAMVLDLRGNSGGTDLLGMRVAQHLAPEGSLYYQLEDAAPVAQTSRAAVPIPATPVITRYAGRVIVLIDALTFSAADNLAACLRATRPEIVFVGRPSGGGSGAPRLAVTLTHSHFEVGYSTIRVYDPSGRLIEGRGTQPDVLVERTRADSVAQRDADLAAAIHELGRR